MSFMDDIDNWIGPPMHPTDADIDRSVIKSFVFIVSTVVIFWLLIFSIWTIQDAFAGTTFTHLSKSVEIVDWDKWLKAKLEADEYARKTGAMVFTHSEVIE